MLWLSSLAATAGCSGGSGSTPSNTTVVGGVESTVTPAVPVAGSGLPPDPGLAARPVPAGGPVVSGSIRTRPPAPVTRAASAEPTTRCSRDHHATSVTTWLPQAHWYNGHIDNTGPAGIEIERGNTAAVRLRAAWLTGTPGSGLNQSGMLLTPMTFRGMLQDAAFVAAGGAVSSDGQEITIPPGLLINSDPATGLVLQGDYFIQSELTWNGAGGTYSVSGVPQDGTFSDAIAEGAQHVFSADWSASVAARLAPTPGRNFGFGPMHVSGIGPVGTQVVAIDGDSLIGEVASGDGTSLTAKPVDLGLDARGAMCFAKRALAAAGYSFFDISVSGTRIADLKNGFQSFAIRGRILKYCDAVITDMGHNDRRSGLTFTDPNGLGPLMSWHNQFLRDQLRPGGRVVRTTLAPATRSTDQWTTRTGQSARNTDSEPGGNAERFNDRVMRRGTFATLARNLPEECDAGFDLHALCTDPTSGFWKVNGTPNFPTADGSNLSLALHKELAAALRPQLRALLGF